MKDSLMTKMLCAALLWAAGTVCAPAQKNGEQSFLKFFETMAGRADATVSDVKYTGTFSSEISGFQQQRGEGCGWTRGRRVRLPHVGAATLDSLRRLYRETGKLQFVNMNDTTNMTTYFEDTSTFYGFKVAADGTFYFLRAVTEGEICVPMDWPVRDYYNHPAQRRGAGDYFVALPKRQQRLVALARLWAGVQRNFVFMDRMKVDWDSLYAAYIPQMEGVKTDAEATRLLQRMVAQAGDGHTYVVAVGSRTQSAPLTTVLLGGKVYVDKVLSSALQKQGVKRGQEVVRVDGREVADWAREEVVPYVSASTPQWRDYLTFCGYGLTTREKGDTVKLGLKDGRRMLEVSCVVGRDDWDLQQREPAVSYRALKNGVGYLRILNFMDSDLRDRFSAAYPEILESRALIIDLRGNEGGNSGNGDFILRHLTADSLRAGSWRSPTYVPALASWNMKAADYRALASGGALRRQFGIEPYTRPVVVLVDRGTFSAAEDFCAVLQGNGRARLVGEPTGGSTGNGVRVVLQDGVSYANICSKHDVGPGGDDFVGRGLLPDVRADEDYDSYFRQSETAAMRAALKLLER